MNRPGAGNLLSGSGRGCDFDSSIALVVGYSAWIRVANLLWIPASISLIAQAGFYRWSWVWAVTGLAVIANIAFLTSPMKFEVGANLVRMTWLFGRTKVLPLSSLQNRARFSIWALLLGSLEVKTPEGMSLSVWPKLMADGDRLKELLVP